MIQEEILDLETNFSFKIAKGSKLKSLAEIAG